MQICVIVAIFMMVVPRATIAQQLSFADAVQKFAIEQGNAVLSQADPDESIFVRLVPLAGGGIGVRLPKNFGGLSVGPVGPAPVRPAPTRSPTVRPIRPIQLPVSPNLVTRRPIVLPPLLTDSTLPQVLQRTTPVPTPTLPRRTFPAVVTTRAPIVQPPVPPPQIVRPPPQPTGISTSFSSSNGGRVCQNGQCFNLPVGQGQFRVFSTSAGCTSVCPGNCEGYVDIPSEPGCPMCRCGAFGVREPCGNGQSCPAQSSGCSDMLCRYAAPVGPVLQNCALTKECQASDSCQNAFCRPKLAGEPNHIPNRDCVFDYECPTRFQCQTLTCFETGVEHGTEMCIFDGQCPPGFTCDQSRLTCFAR